MCAQLSVRRSDAGACRYPNDEADHRGGKSARHCRARPHHRRQGRPRATSLKGLKLILRSRKSRISLTLDLDYNPGVKNKKCAIGGNVNETLGNSALGAACYLRQRPVACSTFAKRGGANRRRMGDAVRRQESRQLESDRHGQLEAGETVPSSPTAATAFWSRKIPTPTSSSAPNSGSRTGPIAASSSAAPIPTA